MLPVVNHTITFAEPGRKYNVSFNVRASLIVATACAFEHNVPGAIDVMRVNGYGLPKAVPQLDLGAGASALTE